MRNERALITDVDHVRLRELLEFLGSQVRADRCNTELLRGRIRQARIIGRREVPPEVVTMNSLVRIRDLDRDASATIALSYPEEADVDGKRISVDSPLGAAMLGRRAGERFEVACDCLRRSVQIEHVYYQPESAGDFHL